MGNIPTSDCGPCFPDIAVDEVMRKIKPAGRVLKGEIILIKGLRWRVNRVSHLNKKVLFLSLIRVEKGETYIMGYAIGVDKHIEWVVTK